MNKSKLYHCGVDELWKRQTGQTFPRTFAHRMGGCEDLIQRLELSGKLRKHRGCVNTVHFNPSGDILVSGSDDREIILWDWAAKVPKLCFHSGHTDNVFQARVMPYTDDKKIVSCAADGQVSEEAEKPQVFEGHRNAQTVKGVSFFGANTEYVVSGSDCGRIYIWKKKGGQLVRMMKGDKQVVNCLEPHPYATILATSGIEKTIKIWTPTAGDRLAVPDDAEELMRNNKRKREHQAHTSFPPEMIMHLLRLQRRRSENGSERRRLDVDFEEDDSILTSYSMDDSTEDDEDEDQDDDSSDDGDHMADQNCIVS